MTDSDETPVMRSAISADNQNTEAAPPYAGFDYRAGK